MTPPGAANASARAPLAPGGQRLAPPRRPRRVSGPARAAQPARRPSPQSAPRMLPGHLFERLPSRLLDVLRALPHQRPLDRLIRGRAWIALVAFALIGIVTLQLGLLQLNSHIGRALEDERLLQRENSSLSVEDSSLSSPEHVEALAALAGMRTTSESSLRFLDAHGGGLMQRAASALARPAGSAGSTASGSDSAATAATGAPTSASETAAADAGTSETSDAGQATGASTDASEAGTSATTAPSGSAAADPGTASEATQTAQSSGAASAPDGPASESSTPAGGGPGEAGSTAGPAGAG
jgi:cell division protein FtsL